MAEIGGAEEIWRNGTLITEEKEDRISALPDSLIHFILSFLPSTKHAIRTGILSKRWRNQWTFVSDLIFNFLGMSPDYSPENISLTTSTISGIIDHTLSLHDCSKIRKFHIISDSSYECIQDPSFEKKIGFAVGKQVEELILKFSLQWKFRLPSLPSLVKLQLFGCSITNPKKVINWKSLQDLSVEDCYCTGEVIRSIVSGSPLLQSLEVKDCFYCLGRLVVPSKSLKRLVVFGIDCCVNVSCPNLVEFYGVSDHGHNFGWSDEVLEKFLSKSPLLESLELKKFVFSNLRIASKFLKKLVFSIDILNEVEISCPRLEELELTGCIGIIRLMNLPSSVCAAINLICNKRHDRTLAKQILEQLQHVNELKLRSFFVESLSALEKDGISHSLLNCKSLTLDFEFGPSYLHIPGIAYALRSSPGLERLVVKLRPQEFVGRAFVLQYQSLAGLSILDHPEENCWGSNETRFCSLMSHLRIVEITRFSQRDYNRKVVLDLVEFLLKNASVLEKMVVVLEDCGTEFVTEVSQKLLSFPRCSAAKIELLCSK